MLYKVPIPQLKFSVVTTFWYINIAPYVGNILWQLGVLNCLIWIIWLHQVTSYHYYEDCCDASWSICFSRKTFANMHMIMQFSASLKFVWSNSLSYTGVSFLYWYGLWQGFLNMGLDNTMLCNVRIVNIVESGTCTWYSI